MPALKQRYLSVLKQKAGEIDAVRLLAEATWDQWNPLFEILPREMVPDETFDEFVARSVLGITGACRDGATIFLDFENAEPPANPINFVESVLQKLAEDGLVPVPVLQLDSPQYIIDGARNFILTNGGCVALRLYFAQLTGNATTQIQQLVVSVGINIAASYFLLDLEEVSDAYAPQVAVLLPNLLGLIPSLNIWNSVTIVGTAIPQVLGIPSGSNAVLPRTEWDLFNQVRNQIQPLVRRLDFGDYTISNPEMVEFDPVTMTIAPKIYYTIDGVWIVYKGRSVKLYGWAQTHAMCQQLAARPEFLGAGYSNGDEYIANCAVQAVTSGNSRTWKRVGTNHHITFVANQVANLAGF